MYAGVSEAADPHLSECADRKGVAHVGWAKVRGRRQVTQVVALGALEAVQAWRAFANSLKVNSTSGAPLTWTAYLKKYPGGRGDERTTVGLTVFPAFAQQILGFDVGQTLAAEVSGPEGRPDFTPADAVTHPYVFEVKGTDSGLDLQRHDPQVGRYLREGRPRIGRVVLTNLVGLRVFRLAADGKSPELATKIDLRALATIPTEAQAAATSDAQLLADFINEHRRQDLTQAEKIDRVRKAPAWNPGFEITSTDWVLTRLDSVVQAIHSDVAKQVAAGVLLNTNHVSLADRALLEKELHELDKRVGSTDKAAAARTLTDYLNATPKTEPGLALQQFVAHTAFYTATRLLLVRAWEDSELIKPSIYDGGFDKMMAVLSSVTEAVDIAYGRAKAKYPELFGRHNAFSWYTPNEDVYINAVYDLANTYLGNLSDDILGDVYQRQLARVDRKQLGQYYTPRDVIKLIWDLINDEALAEAADDGGRPLRVLDIATGSGGFLVEGAARHRRRFQAGVAAGAVQSTHQWLEDVTEGFVGCEVQQFSAYLAEVNLVLQFSPMLKGDKSLLLPGLRVHCADTLTLHNPDTLAVNATTQDGSGLQDQVKVAERQDSIERIRDPYNSGEWLDVACGNPPYVGEKSIAKTLEVLRQQHPYWEQFSASHVDYLYNFLILGVSKLRKGGRFGFITTEYWLKAEGADPLRRFLAKHTQIDRLLLFRRMTLFPDAPGQHNLIVIGERVTDPTDDTHKPPATSKPWISMYTGEARREDRTPVLDAMRAHANKPKAASVRSFRSQLNPSSLGGGSWAEVTMTKEQLARRRAVRRLTPKADMVMAEGVIATPQALKERHAGDLSSTVLNEIGGATSRAGIFVLSHSERTALGADAGAFTANEDEHLKRVVRGEDIFPYATVLPSEPASVIWLPALHGGTNGEFPANMPTLETHLERFKPLLEKTVKGYHRGQMARPWWSAHRPRLELVQGHVSKGRWADLAVTARWGERKLLVALAPANSMPLSGLHAFTGTQGTTAAYLVGLINSTPIQELAEALAPGSVGQQDIEALGLPRFDDATVRDIERRTRTLADLVHKLVTMHAPIWPDLLNVLRFDTALTSPVTRAWTPKSQKRNWGTVNSVGWSSVTRDATVSGVIEAVAREDDLLSRHLAVQFTRGRILIALSGTHTADEEDTYYALLAAVVNGVRLGRGGPDDLGSAPVHVTLQGLLDVYAKDLQVVEADVTDYQANREAIDALVTAKLGT